MSNSVEGCSSMTSFKMSKQEAENFCTLEKLEGGVFILNFTGNSQHRFTLASIRLIDALLDQVLSDKGACALITTNQGKFFSNGMNVKYLRANDKQTAIEYFFTFQRLVSKMLTFCIPTIAVIRGHAVGAGCIFALAHDYRLMISSRAYIVMNEVDLGLSLTPGNMAVLSSKLPTLAFREAVLTGKKYNGAEAAAAGLIQKACPRWPALLEEGISKAMEYKSKNWKREVYHALKMEIFKITVRKLENGGIGFARM